MAVVVDQLRGRYVAPRGHTDPDEIESLLLDVVIQAVLTHTDADRLVNTMVTWAARRVGQEAKRNLHRRVAAAVEPIPTDHPNPVPRDCPEVVDDVVAAYANVLTPREMRILTAVMYLRDGESVSDALSDKDRMTFYRTIRPKMQQRLGGGR